MSKLLREVAQSYLHLDPTGAAAVLDSFDPDEVAETLSLLEPAARVEVLSRMNADLAARSVAALPNEHAALLLDAAEVGRIGRWLGLLAEKDRERLTGLLSERRALQVKDALSFPPGTAGSLMDPGVLSFSSHSRIEHVISGLRGLRGRRVTDIVVCDSDDRLLGVVSLQQLLSAAEGTELGPLAQEAPSVQPMADRDEVVDLLERFRLASLPVVDFERRLLGILRYDALVQAAQQAATDDLQTMVGAGSEERALSPALLTVKSRLPWLFINLATAFAAAAVVGLFDETIAAVTALAVLLPIVAGQSGNTGAQALAVTSRGLALREIRVLHWFRVLTKETLAAFTNGLAVAAVTSAGVLLWSGSAALAGVIGASMVVSMVLAAMSGAIIPILLTALGRDPATASSILLTTVTDITGFFSFLGLATVMRGFLTG